MKTLITNYYKQRNMHRNTSTESRRRIENRKYINNLGVMCEGVKTKTPSKWNNSVNLLNVYNLNAYDLEKIKDIFINENIGLAKTIALNLQQAQFDKTGVRINFDDVISASYEGLVIGATRFFDKNVEKKGIKDLTESHFNQYVTPWIKKHVLDCLESINDLIRIPKRTKYGGTKYSATHTFEREIHEDTLGIQVSDTTKNIESIEVVNVVESLLHKLSETERNVMKVKFMLFPYTEEDSQNIHKVLGIGRTTAHKAAHRATDKIRNILKERGMTAFMD